MSTTAAWIAAARARESTRPDALFRDPYAAALAGERGQTALARSEAASGGENLFLPVRTRHFDDALVDAVARRGIRQVVLLGAGFDARPFRLRLPAETTVFEMDRPEVLAEKERVLGGAPAFCDRRLVPADLDATAAWLDALLAAGLDRRRPTVWLAEGLLYYLTAAAAPALLRAGAAASPGGSRFLADVFGTGQLGISGVRGTPFCTDDPAGLFTAAGWATVHVSRPGAADASYGRLPIRDATGDPTMRAHLVSAMR